jgi:hypothetical protein
MKNISKIYLLLHCMVMHSADTDAQHWNSEQRIPLVQEQQLEIPAYSFIPWHLITGNLNHSSVHKKRRISCGNDKFGCGVCKQVVDDASNINYHLHTKCFPVNGAPCMDCQKNGKVSSILKKFPEILEHNITNHSQQSRWACIMCYAEISKEKFKNHLLSNCNMSIAPFLFDDSCDGEMLIGRKKIPLKRILEEHNEQNK